MIGVEFRDEEYQQLVEEAHELVKDMSKLKKKACHLIKALAGLSEEDEGGFEDEDPRYDDDVRESEMAMRSMYRGGRGGSRMRSNSGGMSGGSYRGGGRYGY